MSKIVILYATAGIGHKKAALAIKEAFDRRGRKDVMLADVLDYTNSFFKFSYGSVYISLVKYIPGLWGFFYHLLDNPAVYALIRPLRRFMNRINSGKLVRFLLSEKPDAVISTHFLPPEVITDMKRKGTLKTRLAVVITDYKSHIFWFSKYVDLYVVGSEYTKEDLVKRGMPEERIRVFGIPCAKSFSIKRNPTELRSKIELEPRKKTIFILGGGFGVGPIKDVVLHLDKLEEDFQGIVVCGYNEKLYKAMAGVVRSTRHTFKIYGFVDNIDELMAASDVLISKPGGITVTEALNAELPMIIINPIPGQEMRNYRFLEKERTALMIKNPKEVTEVVRGLFTSDRLDILRNRIREIRLTDSAERIAGEFDK